MGQDGGSGANLQLPTSGLVVARAEGDGDRGWYSGERSGRSKRRLVMVGLRVPTVVGMTMAGVTGLIYGRIFRPVNHNRVVQQGRWSRSQEREASH